MKSNQLELFPVYYIEPEGGIVCIKCNIRQDENNFQKIYYRDSDKEPEIKRTCRTCISKSKKVVRSLRLENPYPSEDYLCPICERGIQDFKKTGQPKLQNWVLDHCHITETFRGWICHHCNTGIGALSDNVNRVEKALQYLKKHLTSE
jgi:hypothetical protein